MRMTKDDVEQTFADVRAIAYLILESNAARANEVIADVIARRVLAACSLHHPSCDLDFLKARASGQLLDDAPIAVARGKVLFNVGAGRVLPQHRFNEVGALEENVPIQGRQQAQAGHA